MFNRMILTAALVLMVGLPAFSSPARAECEEADKCDVFECRRLHNKQNRACKGGPYDPPLKCSPSMKDKDDIARFIRANQKCLDARREVATCFSEMDKRHKKPIQKLEDAIASCERLKGGGKK